MVKMMCVPGAEDLPAWRPGKEGLPAWITCEPAGLGATRDPG